MLHGDEMISISLPSAYRSVHLKHRSRRVNTESEAWHQNRERSTMTVHKNNKLNKFIKSRPWELLQKTATSRLIWNSFRRNSPTSENSTVACKHFDMFYLSSKLSFAPKKQKEAKRISRKMEKSKYRFSRSVAMEIFPPFPSLSLSDDFCFEFCSKELCFGLNRGRVGLEAGEQVFGEKHKCSKFNVRIQRKITVLGVILNAFILNVEVS